MYSKYKGNTDKNYSLTPPPGYDGSRFRRRSDGRDDSFPLYETRYADREEGREQREEYTSFSGEGVGADGDSLPDTEALCEGVTAEGDADKRESPISAILSKLGSEEILIIALILLIANDKESNGIDTVLTLVLLLCL